LLAVLHTSPDLDNFESTCVPILGKIGTELKRRHPSTPLIVFARGACDCNNLLGALDIFDVITIDGGVERSTAREKAGGKAGLQGNFDPKFLVPGEHTGKGKVREEVRSMLEVLGPKGLIANLGEGLGGKESTELVDEFVRAVHEESEIMIRERL